MNDKVGLEEALEKLPGEVARALQNWRAATLNREKVEALCYLRFKGEDNDRTAAEVKALVNSSREREEAALEELKAESMYQFKSEKLMAAKKLASLRTAF